MKRNETQRNATGGLSTAQLLVLGELLVGHTITAAAQAGGVDRATVYRWLHADFNFIAEFNRQRRELLDGMQARMLRLADSALGVVEGAIRDGNTTAAIGVLRGLGMLRGQAPWSIGLDDPAALAAERELADIERANAEASRREIADLIGGLVGSRVA